MVVVVHELRDFAVEVHDRVEGLAAYRLAGDQSKPALDLIEPGAVRRSELAGTCGQRELTKIDPYFSTG